MYSNKFKTDQEIIKGIREGGYLQEACINQLFEAYTGFIAKGSRKFGITQDEANMAYADAIIVLRKQIIRGGFRGESKVSTYFFRIFCNKCIDISRKNTSNKNRRSFVEVTELLGTVTAIEQDIIAREKFEEVVRHLEKLGEPCSQILLDAHFWGYSMKEVGERHQLGNGMQAARKKYECLKKIRGMIGIKKKKQKDRDE